MKIDILCGAKSHPIYPMLNTWVNTRSDEHDVRLVTNVTDLSDEGDILFLISVNQIIRPTVYNNFKAPLLIHASDLPIGRGWSPHIWEILAGGNTLTITLLTIAEKVDTGAIWNKLTIDIPETDLYDEINHKIFEAELALMDFAVENYGTIEPIEQDQSITPSYYRKRTPEDSELDIDQTIKENFNLMRVADPDRFPSFFYIDGVRYKLYIEKDHEEE